MSKMSELSIEFENEHRELIDSEDLEKLEKERQEFLKRKACEANTERLKTETTKLPDWAFRNLDKKEEKEFRKWARDNYKPNSKISDVWHPVVRDECVKINSEL